MIFREILLEDKVTFLKEKYFDLVWLKYQEKERFKNLNQEQVFETLLSADPTKKNYLQWLVNIYLSDNQFYIEDISRVEDALTLFEKVKSKLAQKDINQYKNLETLYATVAPFEGQEIVSNNEAERRKRQAFFDSGQAELYYKSKTVTIIIPKTKEAAQYFGQGTKWCTAGRNNNMFDVYNKKGPLYILLPMKWQFQFESNSFMDERDTPISSLGIHANEIGKVFQKQFIQSIKSKKTVRTIETETPGNVNLSTKQHNAIMRGFKALGERANEFHLLRSNKNTINAMIVITTTGKLLLDDKNNFYINPIVKQAIGPDQLSSELDAIIEKIIPKLLKEFKTAIPKIKQYSLINYSLKTNFMTNQSIREILKKEKIYQELEILQNQRIQQTLDIIDKFENALIEVGCLDVIPDLNDFRYHIAEQTMFKDPSNPKYEKYQRGDRFDYN